MQRTANRTVPDLMHQPNQIMTFSNNVLTLNQSPEEERYDEMGILEVCCSSVSGMDMISVRLFCFPHFID